MGACDTIRNNVDSCEAEINGLFARLEIIGEYEDLFQPLKDKYSLIQRKYYAERTMLFYNRNMVETIPAMLHSSNYLVALEQNILLPLKNVYAFASCKHRATVMIENNSVDIDEIRGIIDSYMSLSDNLEYKKIELKDYLEVFLYEMIKKDAILNNRFAIIDLLKEYREKGLDFIKDIHILYLNEVNSVSRNNKSNGYVGMVKEALDSDFEDKDIIGLLNEQGYDIRTNIDKCKALSYTDRIRLSFEGDTIISAGLMIDFGINPFPLNKYDNLKLRKYDLTRVTYFGDNLENVDLSGTNAALVPRLLKNRSLRGADLSGVDLRGVNFKNVDITDANLANTGADISGSVGLCLGVSPYENSKIVVSESKITPFQFEELTKETAFPHLCLVERSRFDNMYLCENRILRQYDISCIDYHFEELLRNYKKVINHSYRKKDNIGLDFSYTNIDFDPQEFTEPIVLNLEGVDLRYKNFKGVEKYFANCNLKGTGANISHRYNYTVTPYKEEPTEEKIAGSSYSYKRRKKTFKYF